MKQALQTLREQNPHIKIYSVEEAAFSAYARVITGLDTGAAVQYARTHAVPGEGVVYEPSITGLEEGSDLKLQAGEWVYGDMPVQVGWCYGRNDHLAGLEFHKSSELLVAVTDVLLLLGMYQDIQWSPRPAYDSSKVVGFYVPEGKAVELFTWCLHFAPAQVSADRPFIALIVLPKDTNLPLTHPISAEGETWTLFARNKWLIVHPEEAGMVKAGARAGITGKNIRLNLI